MAMNCFGCLTDIRPEDDVIGCMAKACRKTFHTECANAQRLTSDETAEWICPNCRASAKRGGDNSHTPVRSSPNVTVRKKPNSAVSTPNPPIDPPSPTPSENGLQLLTEEIRLMRQEMSEMQCLLSKRLDDISERFSEYDVRLKELETKEDENRVLRSTVSRLQEQLNTQLQGSLRNELEVLGLSEEPNENPYHLVLTTAQVMGVELTVADLDYVTRVGPKHRKDEANPRQQQRPLVIAFTRKMKRDEFLKQAKTRRSLTSKDVVGNGPTDRIYINERLTSENRRLFRSVRIMAKEHDFKFCWVRNSTIYVRKREGRDGSPAHAIKSEEDRLRLFGPGSKSS